jgi:hypothetical protein
MALDGNHSKAEPHFLPGPDEVIEHPANVEVTLKGVAETLLIPPAARAFDAIIQRPILGDPYAKFVLEELYYDIDKVTQPPGNGTKLALRTHQFDRRFWLPMLTAQFFTWHVG